MLTNHGKKVPLSSVKLSAAATCQLRCKNCDAWQGNYCQGSGDGFLKPTDFEKFIKLNPGIGHIELAHAGEIFLNPNLAEIITIAKRHNVQLSAWGGCNFNNVSQEVLKLMVTTNFDGLCINLDGIDQKTYVSYRRGGRLNTVLSNLKKLQTLKNKNSVKKPTVILLYTILAHNHSLQQLKTAKKIAKELGVVIRFRKDYLHFIPTKKKMVEKETGLVYNEDNKFHTHMEVDMLLPPFRKLVKSLCSDSDEFLLLHKKGN
jgi:MoaA/NifB/PqqE/SkfB family radical SAM enzyme